VTIGIIAYRDALDEAAQDLRSFFSGIGAENLAGGSRADSAGSN
jgi:hypothetical protein